MTPSVFAYASFGEYLAAYVDFQKARNNAFSARALAKRLGRSPSLLTMIARGERRPQPDLIQDLAEHIGLTPVERDFVDTLVNFERAKSLPARARFAAKLRLLKPSNDDLLLTLDQFELISNWYHYTILVMVDLPRFREEPTEIARYLGMTVTPEMVRESLALLERLGLIVRENGRLKKTNATVRSTRGVPSKALRAHHKQMLMRAHQAIERQPVHERFYSSATLAIPASKIKEISDKIVAFREQLMADVELLGDSVDEVYHLNVQFFRATTEPVFPKH